MRVRRRFGTGLVIATSALLALVTAFDASAARIMRIDVGNNLDGNGQFWSSIQAVDLSPDLNSDAILFSLGFTIDFGNGHTYNSLFINENGFVSFADLALGESVATWIDGETDLANVGSRVIAPYYADLTSDHLSGELFQFDQFDDEGVNKLSSISTSTGRIDLAADGDPDTPSTSSLPAFRVTWFDVGVPGLTDGFGEGPNNNQGRFQLVLLDTDGDAGGNFDLEFNYQLQQDTSVPPPNPLAAGFVLGANVVDYLASNGSFTPDFTTGAALFHFCGGSLQATSCTITEPPPTNVSEPDSLTLIVAGAVLLGLVLAMRRRARRHRAP